MKKKNILAVLVLVLSLSIGMVANADTTTSNPFKSSMDKLNPNDNVGSGDRLWYSNGVITLTDSTDDSGETKAVFDARDFETVAKSVIALSEKVDELNDSLNGIAFGQDADGNWGYREAGADTVTPFKKGSTSFTITNITLSSTGSYGSVSAPRLNAVGTAYVSTSNSMQFDVTDYSKVTISGSSGAFTCKLSDGTTETSVTVPTTGIEIDVTNYTVFYITTGLSNNARGSSYTSSDSIERASGSTSVSISINSITFQ